MDQDMTAKVEADGWIVVDQIDRILGSGFTREEAWYEARLTGGFREIEGECMPASGKLIDLLVDDEDAEFGILGGIACTIDEARTGEPG